MVAMIWEIWADRHGDLNKGWDMVIRGLLFCAESVILFLIFHKPLIDSWILSSAIFFMFFDYAINFVLIKNGTLEPPRDVEYHWFRYVAKSGFVDNIGWWRKSDPLVKFFIKIICLAITLIIYII